MNFKERYRRFKAWQQQPHTVAPLSDEAHDCPTCHTHYTGNYCPRCGQSAKIGRYSFKKAFLLFLDVWGLGNRGMFRTLRDLVLRPGYMIRDYLGGMQMAYFPPFKLFFLLATLSLLVTHGLNIGSVNMDEQARETLRVELEAKNYLPAADGAAPDTPALTAEQKAQKDFSSRFLTIFNETLRLQERYPNLFALAWLVFLSGFFYFFFRKSPAIPGLRYSEFLVALVYTANMLSIFSIVCDFFCINDIVESLSWLMLPVALKQLSGFSWKRTLWAVAMPTVLIIALFIAASFSFSVYIAMQQDWSPSREELRMERATRIDSTTVGTVVDLAAIEGYELLDSLTAEAWIVVEDSTGLLISAKNADRRMFPASLTKMMTCLLALEHGQLGDTIEITKDICVTRDTRVKPGDRYVAADLVREMMMLSDNVAALALARHAGGDTLAFCELMNRKAACLHMDSTHFANPNGLPNDSNYSNARDLLTLARYSMADTLFRQMVGADSTDITLVDGRILPCRNTNRLLRTYPGCLGVKTGYTRLAGACLAVAAKRGDVTLVAVVLKSKTHASRFSEAATLLDYGFSVVEEYRRRSSE